MGRAVHLPERLGYEEISPHVSESHGIVGIDGDFQGFTPHTGNIGPLPLGSGMIGGTNNRFGKGPPNGGLWLESMLQRSRRPGTDGRPKSILHQIQTIRAIYFP